MLRLSVHEHKILAIHQIYFYVFQQPFLVKISKVNLILATGETYLPNDTGVVLARLATTEEFSAPFRAVPDGSVLLIPVSLGPSIPVRSSYNCPHINLLDNAPFSFPFYAPFPLSYPYFL